MVPPGTSIISPCGAEPGRPGRLFWRATYAFHPAIVSRPRSTATTGVDRTSAPVTMRNTRFMESFITTTPRRHDTDTTVVFVVPSWVKQQQSDPSEMTSVD